MKLNYLASIIRHEGETITTFGEASLVKHLDGKFELFGGSPWKPHGGEGMDLAAST